MKRPKVRLTPRQRQVVDLVAQGRTYPQIADRLGISARTVEHHVYDVAGQLPGKASPRSRLIDWWWSERATPM